MSERQAIEIDYCPTCRGIWLDRGELDKIIEKSMDSSSTRSSSTEMPRQMAESYYNDSHDHDHEEHYKHGDHRLKRRRSWLGDLFD
jgi:uncharacterized protein